jgi:mannosyltransferase
MEVRRVASRFVSIRVGSAAVGLLATFLGLLFLGRKSFWFDEAYDVVLARSAWDHYLSVGFNHESSQLTYLVLLKPWLELTGEAEWSTRLPSVAFFGLAVFVFTWSVSGVYGRGVGLLAGILLAVDGYVVSLAQQARTYSLVLLLTVVATALLIAALRDDRSRTWLAYAVVASASIYAHFMAAGVLLAHACTVAAHRPAVDRRRLVTVAAIVAGASLPALWFCATRNSGQIDWLPPLSLSAVRGVLIEAVDRNPALLAAALIGAVAAWFGTLSSWRRTLPVTWFIAPILLLLVVSTFQSLLWSRYLVVASPGIALCAAIGLMRLRPTLAAIGVTAIVLVVGVVRVVGWLSRPPIEDWRTADRLVDSRAGTVASITVSPLSRRAGWFVYEQRPLDTPRARGPTWVITGDAVEMRAAAHRRGLRVCASTSVHALVVARLASNC